MKIKIKGNWNIFKIFISGLVSAIFINYLIVGFIDIVVNIDNLISWLERTGILKTIQQFFK